MGKQKKKKKPKKKPIIQTTKHPASSPPANFHTLKPSWRITLLEIVDPYGWHKITSEHLEQVRKRLLGFESMTWGEILADGKNHLVAISHLTKDAQDRLEEIGQLDIDELVSLRVAGKPRVWGILEHSTLKILWWDPEHVVCPSSKKHT